MKNLFLLVVSLLGIVTIAQAGDPIPSVTNNSILLRVDWEFCEPVEKNYDWQFIDGQIESARKQGKKIALLIDPESGLPEWLQNQSNDINSSQPLSTLQAARLSSWTTFIQKMGERYQLESTIEKVYITNLQSGASHQADNRLRQTIYAWMQVVDAFEAAFPQQQLIYSGAWQEDANLSIMLDAYASKIIGNRYQTIPTPQPYAAPMLPESDVLHDQHCHSKAEALQTSVADKPSAASAGKAKRKTSKQKCNYVACSN
jgi:hypothetical protein